MTELNLPFAFYVISASILGLIIGSFLNVVIHRIPLGQSIIFPGSQCPSCATAIRPFDNIPLLGFLSLKGRCRNCGERISWRYPAVELLTGIIFTLIVLKTGPTWEALLEMIFAAIMIALVFIDSIHHLLPNVITYPAIVFALVATALRAGWGEPANYGFDISIIFTSQATGFNATRAAWLGGSLLALATPVFWLLDRLDLILYNKYFDWQEMNEEDDGASNANGENPGSDSQTVDEAVEAEADRRYQRTIRVAMILGLLAAIVWAALCLFASGKNPEAFDLAYGGLWKAVVGALVGSVPIWWLRAMYFYIRGVEGMGLGDVKLMAIIGAFLGWQGAFGVLLVGSIAGSAIGAFMMWRSKAGLKTALPFGVCLGATALIVMLLSTPFFRWYVGL